jgi:hypothetical protein
MNFQFGTLNWSNLDFIYISGIWYNAVFGGD